ncbi:TonB-dependent receptor domain-containing protein [Mucilaginibacter agri]|uniref:TonB-dependent receptor n=1 Tax=Mucilaginibacter agri TaxID=2695265 RepID=A0A965ZM49_9SPHI|nr:TonB-dependent receptor [Mucilaginibacter agri]NCD72464.1 TonB-dependent receptor [Mucilaginibacter agri]
MKALLTSVIILFLAASAKGQVYGRLTDSIGNPVAFATVVLEKSADSTLVHSALSDEKGNFSLRTAPAATYIIKVSCVGYANYISASFTLQTTFNSGTIKLKTTGKQLGEVVIRSAKPLMQQTTGGLVVNVQNSVMTKGSSVLQVLSRSPGVIIDAQTNAISLNGKSGVIVMLDGKLLRLSAAQVSSLLNSITADDIDKIELLTTPPAKYDADGNAGLINIVTKKNKQTGTSGTISATGGYGTDEKASTDLSLNYIKGKISLHGSYNYYHNRTQGLLLAWGTENVPIIGGQTAFNYHGDGHFLSNYNSFNGGLDYRVSARTNIGGNLNYNVGSNKNNNHNYGNYALPDTNLSYSSLISGDGHTSYFHGNFYAEQAINTNQKLNLNVDYFDHNSNSSTQVQSDFSSTLFAPRQQNLANAAIKVSVAQVDYSNLLRKGLQLESGLKGTFTHTKSRASIENLVNGQWVPIGAGTSNDLATRELIGAAYTIVNWNPDSLLSISAGARYEYSQNTTDHSLNAQYYIDRRLGKLFPSIFITRKLNATDQLQLSYTERITRPSYADLASYVSYNDPVSVFTGNPALKPTITKNIKLDYKLRDYLFSIVYSHDANPILGTQVVPGPTSGLVYLTPENADWQNNLTLQVAVPFKPAAWWEMNYGAIGGYHKYRVSFFPELLKKNYFSYTLNFTETFKPAKNYAIEFSGYYNSASYSSNSRSNGNAIFNLGIKRDLPNKNGSFQLSISDIFRGASYYSQLGQLVTDSFNSDVKINYQAESHSFPIIKLSYSRPLGSSGKKTGPKESKTKDEQNRL